MTTRTIPFMQALSQLCQNYDMHLLPGEDGELSVVPGGRGFYTMSADEGQIYWRLSHDGSGVDHD